MSVYGDMTEDEWLELRAQLGDVIYEEPGMAVILLEDLRRERAEALLKEMEEAIRRQERRRLH